MISTFGENVEMSKKSSLDLASKSGMYSSSPAPPPLTLLAVDIFVACADGLDSTMEVIAFNAVVWCHNISTTTGHLHPLVFGVKTAATYRGIMAS